MAMRAVYVPMQAEDADTLIRLALSQFRRPSDQAAWLLREALRQQRAVQPDGQDAHQARLPVEAGAAK